VESKPIISFDFFWFAGTSVKVGPVGFVTLRALSACMNLTLRGNLVLIQ